MDQLQPSPQLFFETATAYQKSAAIKGAVELELFTSIAEGNHTVTEIAHRCSATERGIRILCDYLVIIGFLTKSGDKYDLTPDSAVFLNKHSPAYLGNVTDFILSPMLSDSFSDIATTVKTGTSIIKDGGTVAPENPIWIKFAKAMLPMMVPVAKQMLEKLKHLFPQYLTQKIKVLDVAAGHGIYGITLARQNANAEVVALDWASVLQVACENAERFGVTTCYTTIAGNAFEVDLGKDYDIILLPNFLHHFDQETCINFLKKVATALKPEGKVLTIEFVPNEDRVTPPPTAAFAFVMLASTASGDAYTFVQYQEMFTKAGFSQNEIHYLPLSPQSMIISQK